LPNQSLSVRRARIVQDVLATWKRSDLRFGFADRLHEQIGQPLKRPVVAILVPPAYERDDAVSAESTGGNVEALSHAREHLASTAEVLENEIWQVAGSAFIKRNSSKV
jgi:hypothetical protein